MQQWRQALVVLDLSGNGAVVADALSPQAEGVFERALWLGRTVGTELTLLSVLKLPWLSTLDLVEASAEVTLVGRARELLDQLASRAAADGVHAHVEVISGHPAQDVLREAVRRRPDVVLVAGEAESGRRPRRVGAIPLKIVRKSPAPVWVVQPDRGASPPAILVADDLSEVGQEALRLGVAAAALQHARLVVLHAIEFPLDRRLFRTGLGPQELEAYREKVRSDAQQAVTERLRETDYRTIGPGVQVHVRAGPADVVIEEALEEFAVDLLVIGTKARGGLAGMLLGSTVESLLPVTSCSVLAVKPADFVSPVAPE